MKAEKDHQASLAENEPLIELERPIRISTPAKLILSGEHSVVYGEPAVITAINQRCQVAISCSKGSVVEIEAQGFGGKRFFSIEEILEFTDRSRKLWEQFSQTRDKKFLREIDKEPLSVALIAIGEALTFFGAKAKEEGLKVHIVSSIPVRSGLGSSAAVAVGVVKGVLESFGKKVPLEKLNKIAFEVEKCQHGFPSGGDNSTVVFGGFLRFQRANGQFQIEQIKDIHSEQLPPLLLLQSGQPTESTGEMVALVRERYEACPLKVRDILENIGVVTTQFLDRLQQEQFEKFTPLIRDNERFLEELGVVGEKAQGIIREIKAMGGVAKICGAGGVKEGSGMLLCLHEKPEQLVKFAQDSDLEFLFPVKLGEKGIRWERK